MEIHWHDAGSIPSEERERVARRLEAIAAEHGDLIDLWVDVKENPHHRHGGDEVTIRCQASGREIVSHRKADEAGLALREALAAFEHEVREWRDRREEAERHEPPPLPPHLGIVDRIHAHEGYGFLLTDGGERIYFHRNALTRGLDFAALREGDRVGLDYEPGNEGPQAIFVEPAPPDAPTP